MVELLHNVTPEKVKFIRNSLSVIVNQLKLWKDGEVAVAGTTELTRIWLSLKHLKCFIKTFRLIEAFRFIKTFRFIEKF